MDLGTLGRIPPQNIQAEQSVLGALLLDKEVLSSVTEVISGQDFYRDDHKEIFEAVIDLYERAEPIDLITISEQLKARGTLDSIGGLEYLAYLANSVPTTANAKHYAGIVEEKSILRKLIRVSSEIVNMGYEASEEVSYVLDKAEQSIFDVMQKRNTQGFALIKKYW